MVVFFKIWIRITSNNENSQEITPLLSQAHSRLQVFSHKEIILSSSLMLSQSLKSLFWCYVSLFSLKHIYSTKKGKKKRHLKPSRCDFTDGEFPSWFSPTASRNLVAASFSLVSVWEFSTPPRRRWVRSPVFPSSFRCPEFAQHLNQLWEIIPQIGF